MDLTRLPAPESSVFSGDPQKFLECRMSFKTLIELGCTNPANKLFYLQKYISGEAQSVLEESFYRKEYPTFREFADFVAQEAKIACNPVTSFHAIKLAEEKPSKEVKRSKANALVTNMKASDKSRIVPRTYSVEVSNSFDSNRSYKVNTASSGLNPVTCRCCRESHPIHKCQTFTSKSVEDKRKFILDINL